MTGSSMFHVTRGQKALVSWGMDVAAVTVVIILFHAWMQDLFRAPDDDDATPLHLAPSFLEKGFCTSPTFHTHLLCASFDVMVGVAFLIAAAVWGKSSNKGTTKLIPLASYLLSHGYGHYEASQIASLKEMTTLDTRQLLTLAAILSIGPLGGMVVVQKRFFNEANKKGIAFYGSVIVADLALVALYVYGLGRRQHFALLYINLSILFTSALPRAALIGYTSPADVSERLDDVPYFWLTMLGRAAITALVAVEPFYCDAFLVHYSGHFLFDFSLAWDAVMTIVNDIAVATNATADGSQADKAKVKFV